MAKRETLTLSVSRALSLAALAKAREEHVKVSQLVSSWLQAWLNGTLPTPRKEAVQLPLMAGTPTREELEAALIYLSEASSTADAQAVELLQRFKELTAFRAQVQQALQAFQSQEADSGETRAP